MEACEVWKSVKDYDNYEVSNLGKVRNKKTGRILKAHCNGGYLIVGLSYKGKTRSHRVHQLVALAFIDNPENKPQVNHIDKDGTNNKLSNLEWCTSAEDAAHKLLTLIPKTNQNLKIWRLDIVTGDKLELYNSIYEASLWCVNNGYSQSLHNAKSYISCAVRSIHKTSCGFKWALNEQPTLEGEIWKNVNIGETTVDNYQVSSLGRFKNAKGVIMENYKPHHSGYIFVRVNKEKYQLHRLVAFTFIVNPHSKPVVNHIDGNKTNNSVVNLEWVTVQENNQHNHNAGLIRVFTRKIGQYNLEETFIKEYASIVEAKRETKISSIKEVLHKRQNTAGGFIWKYLD
jgi:hypothetical protein